MQKKELKFMKRKNIVMKKSKKGGIYISFLFYLLIGAVCGVMTVLHFDFISVEEFSLKEYLYVFAPVFICIFVSLYFHIIIHETGHLLFGLMTGYRFSSFRIGNYMWIRERGKIKMHRMSLAGTAGQCLMAPPDMIDGKIPYVLYNLGGSIMNFAAAVISIGLSMLFWDVSYVSLLFSVSGVFGLGLAFLNGFPLRMGTVDNDGYNAKSLGKSPTALRAFWIQLKINELSLAGIRLKDMPQEWFQMPAEYNMDNSMTAALAVFCENRLMDMNFLEQAEQMIDKLFSEDTAIVELHSRLLICDRIYCELVRGKNIERIQQILTKQQIRFMNQMKKFPAVLRTEFTIALLYEKNEAKGRQIKAQFEKRSHTYPYKGDLENERELMQIAEDAAGY